MDGSIPSGEQDETQVRNKSWGDICMGMDLKSAKAGSKPKLGENPDFFFEVRRENSLVNIFTLVSDF